MLQWGRIRLWIKSQAKPSATSMARKMRASMRPHDGPLWVAGGSESLPELVTVVSLRLRLPEWDLGMRQDNLATRFLGLRENIGNTNLPDRCLNEQRATW